MTAARFPVTLLPRRSRAFLVAVVLAHGAGTVGLLPTSLPLAVKIGLWVALGLSLFTTLRRRSVLALTLKADGRLEIVGVHGDVHDGEVLPATTALPWVVVLLVRSAGVTRSIALPADALTAEQHRMLRLWLRWKVTAARA